MGTPWLAPSGSPARGAEVHGEAEVTPERLRDPSCVAALTSRAPEPAPEQAAPAWVPVEHTVPLPRRATAAGDARAGARPPALVQMAAWAGALSADDHEDNDAWVRAIPVVRDADKRRAHPALLGTVVFVLGVLCGVVLAILRLR
ncbi:hypothetical protein [Sorangium sp. So ce1151]|uniref:hypothetical protein n=1 Tax=Sorangium sp. So ce1151 TaxID=3133332 RepID=UPI003F627AE0